MSVLKKNELMEKLKTIIGDKTDDETIAFLEDVNDTFDSKESNDNTDWKKKCEETEKHWREKYRDRFFNKTVNDDEDDEEEEEQNKANENETKETEKLTFENLFKEE